MMKTLICGGCDNVIKQRRLRLQCTGLCGRFFHIPCTDVPLELYHSVCRYPSFAWRCWDCSKKLQFWSPSRLNQYFLEKIKSVADEIEERLNRSKEELVRNTLRDYRKALCKKLAYEAFKKNKACGTKEEDGKEVFLLQTGQRTLSNAAKTKAEREKERERKIGHRRVGVGGRNHLQEDTDHPDHGINTTGACIQHAVGGLASKPERDLLMQDFMTVETTNFPSEGSNHTPAHHFSEFKFKNYAPIAFRYFRDLFGIQPDDFLMSMCNSRLRELSNPGASGSIFYVTADDEFIIKTVQHKEGEFLQKLLAGYYMNLNQNPRTLLPKFFGLYCYQCNSKNVRLVIMNNLLPSNVVMHQKYDLKGSTYKRKASKAEGQKRSPTYKDLDFMEHHPEGILMEADTYNALVKTIQRDCRVLESFKIMDYSLLLAIHNLDQAQREKLEKKSQPVFEEVPEESGDAGNMSAAMIHEEREHEREDRIGAASVLNRTRSINRQRLVAHSTAMESIQAESEPIDEDDDTPRGGIPARNAKGERLLLFIGIIDILQSYRLKKKLEHTWKSMIHDGDTVSVHRPSFYAQRFQKFMSQTVFKKIPSPLKHSPSKRKSLSRPMGRHEELHEQDTTVQAQVNSSHQNGSKTEKKIILELPSYRTYRRQIEQFVSGVQMESGLLHPLYMLRPAVTSPASSGPLISPPAAYPAILLDRSNSQLKGKVPPPVPPRGTPKVKRVDSNGKGAQSFGNVGDVDLLLHVGKALRPLHGGSLSGFTSPRRSGRRRHRECYSDDSDGTVKVSQTNDLLKVEVVGNASKRDLKNQDLYTYSKCDYLSEDLV
ncbi:hypothetical protein NQ315_009984 [Exocentrus adspersus]|uniref:PIPK domain-containing protein n=1 Tax=Exocentrus adspersus TaxID=1586481 RepID=A0AAV8WJ73_9CUCU|nr:hypothetical protein NQ315_009984 [Exocentrus adspersus]